MAVAVCCRRLKLSGDGKEVGIATYFQCTAYTNRSR
jgi:hypothetical protein